MYREKDGEILRTEIVQTERQKAEICTHFCFATEISVAYDPVTDTLVAEYRDPVIEGTEWQGGLKTNENRPMLLSVDGSDPVEIAVSGGIAKTVLHFEAPGTYTYTLRVAATFPCKAAELEVVP